MRSRQLSCMRWTEKTRILSQSQGVQTRGTSIPHQARCIICLLCAALAATRLSMAAVSCHRASIAHCTVGCQLLKHRIHPQWRHSLQHARGFYPWGMGPSFLRRQPQACSSEPASAEAVFCLSFACPLLVLCLSFACPLLVFCLSFA